ncbi:MAG: aminodeoxychorismate synthase component I [Culicoidibacterales bacterium]
MVITERATRQIKPEQLIQLLTQLAFPVWLDSAKSDPSNRYSFLAAQPLLYIQQHKDELRIHHEDGRIETSEQKPLGVFAQYEQQYARTYEQTFPFHSGWLGFFSYDFHHELEKIPQTTNDEFDTPGMGMGLYDGVFVYDHHEQCLSITALGLGENTAQQQVNLWQERLATFKFQPVVVQHDPQSTPIGDDVSVQSYQAAFKKLKNYIASGDLYQMNLTHQLKMPLDETPLELYLRLRELNPAPFAAYLQFDELAFACSSPERFLQVKEQTITTRPIKGTRKRGQDAQSDAVLKQELWESEKDRAELLMIIDLQRNDLAKIAQPGTVHVPELYTVETYPTVFHLVSTIQAKLAEQVTPAQIIAATFPGGSITGAPKIRAMEVIDELEVSRRGIYTGSIGYIDCNRNCDFNIVIRTIVCHNHQAYFHVGGGIVWDSTVEFEYEETFQKAAALIAAIRKQADVLSL